MKHELSKNEIDALLSKAAGRTAPEGREGLEGLLDVPLEAAVRLGEAELTLEEVAKLEPGKVVALDRLSGDPVDLLVNGTVIARGEIVVVDDRFCVRITEILAKGRKVT